MNLTELTIHHLRNIAFAKLSLHSRCNFFYGPNGSGKTSLLEALYLLSSGHSFRTREISPLVRQGETALTVFSHTSMGDSISIQKSISGPTQVKLKGVPCQNSSELAHFLPCQVFYQDLFQIMDAGPSARRMLLDWGLFHVEQSYHALWKEYRHVIKQRNALLRQKAHISHYVPWDHRLIELAYAMDHMRATYFEKWANSFQMMLEKLTDIRCQLVYYKGWDKRERGKHLSEILAEQLVQDIQRQYTYSGPHQADILFDLSSNIKAKQCLSRGQQKIILIAMKLAQASLVSKDCIYLLDDVSAELDAHHVSRLLACLQEINGQFYFTAVHDELLSELKSFFTLNAFVVKQGTFTVGP